MSNNKNETVPKNEEFLIWRNVYAKQKEDEENPSRYRIA